MPNDKRPFGTWLDATMRARGLSQAELARAVGVADAQVSRWRRGRVVPTVRYLQQIADVIGVQRVALDRLAGYPIDIQAQRDSVDAETEAEITIFETRLRDVLLNRLPHTMWHAYMNACEALADGLSSSVQGVLDPEEESAGKPHNIGFRR